jgi:hypothetical protein
MDILRYSTAFLIVLAMAGPSNATPVDTTWDLLYAVEYGNGSGFMELLTESLNEQVEAAFDQLKAIAAEDPSLAEELMASYGVLISAGELETITLEEFVSDLLYTVNLPPLEEVVSEQASLEGRRAQVVFTWYSGYSMTFQLVWEASSWRITGASVIDDLF